MNPDERRSAVLNVIQKLKENGSWCGETHVQKTMFFFNHLAGERAYPYILYKHGPYSFDLHDELGLMQIYHLIGSNYVDPRYGPKLQISAPDDAVEEYLSHSSRFNRVVEFLGERLGPYGVGMLEQLATALYFTKEKPVSQDQRVQRIREEKPHISVDSAERAIEKVDEILEGFKASGEGV